MTTRLPAYCNTTRTLLIFAHVALAYKIEMFPRVKSKAPARVGPQIACSDRGVSRRSAPSRRALPPTGGGSKRALPLRGGEEGPPPTEPNCQAPLQEVGRVNQMPQSSAGTRRGPAPTHPRRGILAYPEASAAGPIGPRANTPQNKRYRRVPQHACGGSIPRTRWQHACGGSSPARGG